MLDQTSALTDQDGRAVLRTALVHGSGFRCIIEAMPRSGVATDEVPEAKPIQVREIALQDTQLAPVRGGPTQAR